ncbi:MAG: L,D-transpeptidase [Chloroflexota bacterium]
MLIKHKALLILFLTGLLFLSTRPVQAEDGPQNANGSVLCLPDVYINRVSDCIAAGPSQYLTTLAENGLTLPLEPLPVSAPDFELTYASTAYGFVRSNNAPIYGSIADALEGKKRNAVQRIDASFSYISYADEAVVDGKRFYMVSPGAWMTASDVSRVSAPRFQGYEIGDMPVRPFGWILTYLSPTSSVETKRTPGYQVNDFTGHLLYNHELVWVYDTVESSDGVWYNIGPDEWIHQHLIAIVSPNPTPPAGVTGDRWIEINLFEQTIAVYDHYQLVFATIIASGLDPFWTRPGVFQIYEKLETTPMSGAFTADRSDAYYLEDVPWTMYFDEARAIHGAYWRANLGFPQSHGCINTSIGDARWLFDWAEVGDWVYVWDPSGETPVDDSVYGAGGA